jgi:hypothetical protein
MRSRDPTGKEGHEEVEQCPFAGGGMKTPALAACPGFEPDEVPVSTLRHHGAGELSCRHLTAMRNERGFIPSCGRPGGVPISAEDAAALIELVQREQGLEARAVRGSA